jgi:septum formation protein
LFHFDRPLILASKSPRRAQLLREAGFVFSVQASDVDEDFDPDMPVEAVAGQLAVRKATAMRHLIQDREVILSADSVVILHGKIYNKPADYAEAFHMIRQLSGQQHTVITGVCLLTSSQMISFSGVSKVWFGELTDAEIDYYIHTCQPYDKAGAYGVQEWIGHCKIKKIEGTYANVMGLPVDLVYDALLTLAG